MSLTIQQYALAHALDVSNGGHRMEPWPAALPDHLSPTSISKHQRCPEAFRQRYVLGRKERAGEGLAIGSAVHEALEYSFREKISTRDDLPTGALLDYYDDVAWPASLEEKEEVGLIIWDTTEELAHARGKLMLGEYHNQVSPRVQPLAVEQWIDVDFGAPVPVRGRYDVETEHEMIDIKTGKRKQSKPKEDWRVQGGIYHEHAGKPVAFHVVSATEKTSTVSIQTPLDTPRLLVAPSVAQRQRMRENVRMIAATIQFYFTVLGPEEPWPTLGEYHDWACDWCGFRSDCVAWQ